MCRPAASLEFHGSSTVLANSKDGTIPGIIVQINDADAAKRRENPIEELTSGGIGKAPRVNTFRDRC